MITLINKPYPFYFSVKRNFKLACIVGLAITILNLSFSEESVYIQYFSFSKFSISIFFGLITFFSVQVILFEKWYSKEKQEKWKIKSELKSLFILHVFVGCLNYLLLLVIAKIAADFYSITFFLSVLASSIIIGMLPTSLIVWVDYTIKLKNNLSEVERNNVQLKASILDKHLSKDFEEILLLGTNTTSELNFNLKDLLFVKSDGNYVDVYIKENNTVVKQTARISIRKIEEELSKYKSVVRTHRSYLVHIENIKHTQGNARNYQLLFHNTDIIVPVSRSQFNIFNDALKNHTTARNK
jgi:hypothetical protein